MHLLGVDSVLNKDSILAVGTKPDLIGRGRAGTTVNVGQYMA